MAELEVIEFVRPNGRQRPRMLVVEDALDQAKAQAIRDVGFRFTIEDCGGFVNTCIEDPVFGDIVLMIAYTTKEYQEQLTKAVNEFDLDKWVAEKAVNYKNTLNPPDEE